MTTITDTLTNPAGTGVGGVVVRATLVAASEVLTGGGAIIRETETTTAADGTWTLTLTPIDDLAVAEGAYYLVTADGHRWTIDVPNSGAYALDDVQIEPAPLPGTGATAAAVAAHAADTTAVHGVADTAALISTTDTAVGFFGATRTARPAVVGSRGGNLAAVVASLLSALDTLGLVDDQTTA
jgi:hypothetical protein